MRELVDEVVAAMDLVVDEVESAIADVKADARLATDDERFQDLDLLRTQLESMRSIANAVVGLRQQWTGLRRGRYADDSDSPAVADQPVEAASRRYLGRVKRGTRTPEAAFREPILRALVELGGSGTMTDVLDRVAVTMKDRLVPVDLEALPSNPETIRWRNTAQWSRNLLVSQDLMLPVRRRGIWEISDQGRAWLEDH